MNASPFAYRIVGNDTLGFMPQRGVPLSDFQWQWVDGVPSAAPSLEAAKGYVTSMQQFDGNRTVAPVVWELHG